jgi:hypothetical protein
VAPSVALFSTLITKPTGLVGQKFLFFCNTYKCPSKEINCFYINYSRIFILSDFESVLVNLNMYFSFHFSIFSLTNCN